MAKSETPVTHGTLLTRAITEQMIIFEAGSRIIRGREVLRGAAALVVFYPRFASMMITLLRFSLCRPERVELATVLTRTL